MDIETTSELTFTSELEWAAEERTGSIQAGGQTLEFSVPRSMGGRGVGTDPEGLLTSAVGACYTSTLASLLAQAGLPHRRVRVHARATVLDHPGPRARIASIEVSPTIRGAAVDRADDYRAQAERARQHCFIGRHLRPDLDYRVGQVTLDADEGAESEALDVRSLPPPRRHQTIFALLDRLPMGEALTLVNDHDPLPLRYQLEATRGHDAYGWEYLEAGPEVWRVRIRRRR
jgi:peroxiredoxin-like protein